MQLSGPCSRVATRGLYIRLLFNSSTVGVCNGFHATHEFWFRCMTTCTCLGRLERPCRCNTLVPAYKTRASNETPTVPAYILPFFGTLVRPCRCSYFLACKFSSCPCVSIYRLISCPLHANCTRSTPASEINTSASALPAPSCEASYLHCVPVI